MKKSMPLILLPSALLAACGPNKIIADLPSPGGKYHVEVRKCPQPGAMAWTEQTQVSILESGTSEWISDTELRAWHPGFDPKVGPQSASFKHDVPVKLIFSPG